MRHQDNPSVLLSSHLTSLTEGVDSSLVSVSHLIDSSPSKGHSYIVYSYFMPVCRIVKTITPRCRGRPDALLHEAKCNSASSRPWYRGVIV